MPDALSLLIPVVLAWYAGASVVAAALCVIDKRAARRGARRIRERTLLRWEALGGFPGAMIAQRTVRHKTRKRSYRVRQALIIGAHASAWALALWLALR